MSWADTSAGVMKMRNGANSAWISLYELDGTFLASDISLAAGSAAAPSLFFTGDTNTGLFSPGADTVALATAGSNRLHITSGGLVGIGTSAPGSALDVRFGTSPATDNGNGTNALRAWTTTTLAVDAGGAISLGGTSGAGQGAFGQIAGRKTNATSEDYAGYLQFATNTSGGTMSERMRITSGGNVGIGTTTPGELLDVVGSGVAGIRSYGASGNAGFVEAAGNANVVRMRIQGNLSDANLGTLTNHPLLFNVNNTERARIDTSGRLLVGTSSGNYDFQVGATGAAGVAIDKANNAVHGTFGTGGGLLLRAQLSATSGGGQIYLGGSTRGDADINTILLSTSNVERIRVTSTGKTFLSSTDNSYGQLQIGNTTSEGECSITFIPGVTAFGTAPTSTNGDSRIWAIGPNAYSVGATQFAIGNKGVGTYVAKLASNTATSWTFSSDERLKNIEGPVVAATQIIEAINPIYYSFKADSAATRKVGLIAQNVLSVLPEVVDVPEEEQDAEGKQQYMGLAMTDLVPVLIAALKESNLKIKELTDRVAALEGA
jgi:hypothetical protein